MKIPVENAKFEGKIGKPEIDEKNAKLIVEYRDPIIIAGSYSDTEIKLFEADFFLKFIEQNSSHHAFILFGLSGFLAASRSVTLYLQKECAEKEGFNEWYVTKQELLKENEYARFITDERNISAHKMYSKITVIYERRAKLNKKKMKYEVPNKLYIGFEFDKYEFKPGLDKCKEYLQLLKSIINEAKEKGFLTVNQNQGLKVKFMITGLP